LAQKPPQTTLLTGGSSAWGEFVGGHTPNMSAQIPVRSPEPYGRSETASDSRPGRRRTNQTRGGVSLGRAIQRLTCSIVSFGPDLLITTKKPSCKGRGVNS
jgi:hypothetical protein